MAMEAGIANVMERGEKLLVGNNGIWGARVCDLADRYGLQVRRFADCRPLAAPHASGQVCVGLFQCRGGFRKKIK